MKSKAYQVKITKVLKGGKLFESVLCNNSGKTIVSLPTAQKWAENYRIKFMNTNHKFGEVLIQILPY